jgi:hypothetical protein
MAALLSQKFLNFVNFYQQQEPVQNLGRPSLAAAK